MQCGLSAGKTDIGCYFSVMQWYVGYQRDFMHAKTVKQCVLHANSHFSECQEVRLGSTFLFKVLALYIS